jgi:hypothetical protein
MTEQLYKLSPNRDLQSYFYMPSAIAALSGASDSGFTVSGSWRQQFDGAVVEWNRDNVFEHPALRYLPDGDLSGLQLTYVETRTNCVPFESNLYPTTDWPNLRIWAADATGNENIYFVPLVQYANPVTGAGTYQCASATFTLAGVPTAGSRVGLCMPTPADSYQDHHYYVDVEANDGLPTIAMNLANNINSFTNVRGFSASANGTDPNITVTWAGNGTETGSNGNRITVYGFVSANASQYWVEPVVTLHGGTFPDSYQVSLNFGSLSGYTLAADGITKNPVSPIPTTRVRKMRWTWAPDLQPGSFLRTEFSVVISNWNVSGTNRAYFVAGPGSRRIEDTDPIVRYSGTWANPSLSPVQAGNYSGGQIHFTSALGDSCTFTYSEASSHELYLGTRFLPNASTVSVSVDGTNQTFPLSSGDDVLVRIPLGTFAAGNHSVVIGNTASASLFFDFVEIVYPSDTLPEFSPSPQLALATDWDTYHSQSLPAERTAWMINKLGFCGRVNHYVGALWFYELALPGHLYQSATVTITQNAVAANYGYVSLFVGPDASDMSTISHLILPDDTSVTVAQAFANLINQGYTSVWASVSGNQLTVTQRALTPWPGQPAAAPQLYLSASADSNFSVTPSAQTAFSGGVPGETYDTAVDSTLRQITSYWRTDISASSPTLNRAARDWSAAYFQALASYGMDVVAAFSTEMKNADPNQAAGLAQRRIDDTPVIVNTPAVMTNFSPGSLNWWTRVYIDTAQLQAAAGLEPYLQSGEVQWWYYPWNIEGETPVSMPFYDAYTQEQFEAKYGVPMQVIASNTVDPSRYPDETVFLSSLIGQYTSTIRTALRAQFPDCRYEVLYPTDTNDVPPEQRIYSPTLDQLVNFPNDDWTPANLNCLKTESFTFTGNFNLEQSKSSMNVSAAKGFPNAQRSHLVGIGSALTAWGKEIDFAQAQGMESVVLFALDQYSLIGYPPPPFVKLVRSGRQA